MILHLESKIEPSVEKDIGGKGDTAHTFLMGDTIGVGEKIYAVRGDTAQH